jgi:hypothetical protein
LKRFDGFALLRLDAALDVGRRSSAGLRPHPKRCRATALQSGDKDDDPIPKVRPKMANPQARTAGLTVRQLPEETLVYDLARHKAHCLNPTATLVWKLCDGSRDRAELNRAVARDMNVRDAEAIVGLALEQLAKRHLLDVTAANEGWTPVAEAAEVRHSRRDALRKLVAAMVAMPAIVSLTAPKAHAQLSRGQLPAGLCTADADCAAGQKCCGGLCTNVMSDSVNCGACSRICNLLTERCDNGRCVQRGGDGGGGSPCSPGTCTTSADCPQGQGCFEASTIPCSGTCIPTDA